MIEDGIIAAIQVGDLASDVCQQTAHGVPGRDAGGLALSNKIRSFGAIITIDCCDFLSLIGRQHKPLVLTAIVATAAPEYRYLASYKGFGFFTQSSTPLELPPETAIIRSSDLRLP